MAIELNIRECLILDELAECVQLQRDVFALPEVELSPVRHLIVTKNAGGFTLGAYDGDRLIGFGLSVPAFLRGERAFYSHMTAVHADYQSHGIGGKLKWAQRERALADGVRYIKWTFEPVKARNAYFNLEKLGATIAELQEDFYGTDYATAPSDNLGLSSDRLFAEWDLVSPRVVALSNGEKFVDEHKPTATVQIMNDWQALVEADIEKARAEQLRIRDEFQSAFGSGMVCRGFHRDEDQPSYLLYKD